ncbi:MAG TPA: SGNH/GDSL hydrolase family protein [Chloroflexota bacterium]
MRLRVLIGIGLIAAIIASAVLLTHAGAQSRGSTSQSYYVALGDSNAHGHTADNVPDDPQCLSAKAPGYVCVVYRYMQKTFQHVGLRNFSRSGADSCEVAGLGHGCLDTTTPRASQLVPAVAFLKAHARHVRLITIDIGGNDVLELALQGLANLPSAEARLPTVYAEYRTNLDTILSTLRRAAPRARIIISTQWNPLGGLAAPPLPQGFPQAAQSALDTINGIMKQESPKYRVKVADAATVMNAYPGGGVKLGYVLQTAFSGSGPNIHPTPKGHKIWAQTIIRTAFGVGAT